LAKKITYRQVDAKNDPNDEVGCAFLYTMNLSKCCFPRHLAALPLWKTKTATVFKRMFTTMLPDPLDDLVQLLPHSIPDAFPHQTSVLERGGYRFVEP
jgi:hypothetical protein